MDKNSNIRINEPTLPSIAYQELMLTAARAAIEAGELSLRFFKNESNKVKLKWDFSPVSDADKAVGQKINESLRGTGIHIISEEEKIPSYQVRRKWGKAWIVDPIDGTRDFIAGGTEFTVNIGLVESNRATMGVIYLPTTRELYYGLTGIGAFKQKIAEKELDPDLFSAHYSIGAKKENEKLVVVMSRSKYDLKLKRYIEKLTNDGHNVESIKCGSSIKYCLMAEGRANLFVRLNTIKEWDTAAGQAIAEASGCIVVGLDGESPVLYNKKKMLTLPNLTVSGVDVLKKIRMSEHN